VEIFLVKGMDNTSRIVLHDVEICKDRNPSLWCFDMIHTEKTRKKNNTTGNGLEGFSHVVKIWYSKAK